MSNVTGKRQGSLGPLRVLAPVIGLVALVGCSTFEDNPSPNPSTVSSQDLEAQPYPNLSQVPDKPPPVTPEQIRASTAAGLEADRANAQYTAPLTAQGTAVQSAAPPSPTPAPAVAAAPTPMPETASAPTPSPTPAPTPAPMPTSTPSSSASPSAAASAAAQPVTSSATAAASSTSAASSRSATAATHAAQEAAAAAPPSSGAPTSIEQTTTAVAAAGVPNQVTGRTSVPAYPVPPSPSGQPVGSAPSAAATQAASPYSGGSGTVVAATAATEEATATASGAASTAATTAAAASPTYASQPIPTGTPEASTTPGARAVEASRRQRRATAATTTAAVPVVSSTSTTGASAYQAAVPATQPVGLVPMAVPPPMPQAGATQVAGYQAAVPQVGMPIRVSPGAAAAQANALPGVPQQGTIGQGAVQLVAVIYFANGSDALDGRDIAVLREVAAIQRQYGGVIRVIGHASSRTAVLPEGRHEMVNLEVSFNRAEAVGQALLRQGLPADALVLEGVSDRQPVYHEFMVTGEAGNRRAEIFLEY